MKINRKFYFFSACLLFAFMLLSHSYPTTQGWDFNFEPAKTGDEYLKLIADPDAKIIRSHEDFYKFVKADPKLRKVFNSDLMRKFTARMKFARGGLQTFHYGDLKRKYPRNYKAILRRMAPGFGLSPELMLTTDYDDMYCASTATCKTDTFSICIGANC